MSVQRDLLSVHKTVAIYDGQVNQPCFFMTSLCPDMCGHGGITEIFSIVKYLKYEKPGQYGDPKSDKYHVQPSDPLDHTGLTEDRKNKLAGLTKGDYVLLSWNHDYVHRDGCSSPERPITKLEKISKEEVQSYL